jgi:hypothetical protein
MSLFSTNYPPRQLFFEFFLNPFPAHETRGDFLTAQRQASRHVGQGRPIHNTGHIISRIKENAAEAADRFLRTTDIAGDRNAVNGGQNTIKMAHDFAHGYFRRAPRQKISAANARAAIHPSLGFQGEHDLLQKALRHVIAPGQFPDGDGQAAKVIH